MESPQKSDTPPLIDSEFDRKGAIQSLLQELSLLVEQGGDSFDTNETYCGASNSTDKSPPSNLAERGELGRTAHLIGQREAFPESKTFAELADHWIEKVAKVRNKSWQNQKRRIEIHILPRWAGRDLRDIRRRDVVELVDSIDGSVAPERVLAITRTLFRYALGKGWIETSPAEGVANPYQYRPRDRFLSMSELAAVYQAAETLDHPYSGFLKMMILSGQRRTEVASMRWDDLDLVEETWVLKSESTKSSRAHLVPLSPAMTRLLKATLKRGPFVWSTDGETHIKGYSKMKTRLDGALAANGHELSNWRFHDLRRTMATHMVRLGVPELVVGRILNHAPSGVTARVYALHSYEAEKRRALTQWGEEVDRYVN